ncbi:MAG: NAD(P)H-dependent oxidoreductase [Alphaproteobacteria bacterium]|nr:NAD(P)H-dependent oxidoreductase [Alphaproteobacteria bacterium]MBV9694195.1 NAD(P)H-dependent oxidoreductase [Alphaproteobacteria bacterium]
MLPKLHTVIASTRPGRIGPAIGRWFHEFADSQGKFDARLVDLAEFQLPVYDEPHHPMRRQYEHEHTRRWSASVGEADAFVFVLPEYNYSPPPAFVNAIDYLFWEWQYKPVGLVSYGGVSAGLRAAQQARLMTSTLKMMPVPEGVALPNVFQQLADGKFVANELNTQGAAAMLNEMHKWSLALAPLREGLKQAA